MARISVFDIPSEALERQLQARRLLQVANVLSVLLLFMGVQAVLTSDWLSAGLVLAAFVCVRVGRQLNLRGRVELSVVLVLCVLTALVSVSLWFSQGLYSGAVLCFPAILIVAGMVASRAVFVSLLLGILAVVAFLTFAALSGLQRFDPLPLGVGRLINVSCILLISAAAVWLLASDLRKTLLRLQLEIRRVRESQADFEHLTQHDPLTGLPNRVLARARAEQAIARAGSDGVRAALIYLDLDNFKTINESFGHLAGDEFLQEAAQRLRGVLRDIDTLSRQGGDEFLLVLADVAELTAISQVVSRIQQVMRAPIELQGMQLVASLSLGVSVYPQDGEDFDTLIKHAETAMYQAKAAGRNVCRYFDAGMNADARASLALEQDLRRALQRGEFELYYQPMVDLSVGRLCSVEALLRWHHPALGVLGPDRFIPQAEQSGLIVELGAWALDAACQQARRWQTAGLPAFAVAVNLSAVQFHRGDLERLVGEALTRHGLAPSCLELELTESILLDDCELLGRLKGLGVRLAIDDFGTGYSSLSYLQRFNVDKLKIDQSFVRGITGHSQNRAIVAAIAQMAHALGLCTVAEGVEDEATCRQLAELGCDQGQGYWFSRPLPVGALEAFARRQVVRAGQSLQTRTAP